MAAPSISDLSESLHVISSIALRVQLESAARVFFSTYAFYHVAVVLSFTTVPAFLSSFSGSASPFFGGASLLVCLTVLFFFRSVVFLLWGGRLYRVTGLFRF